MTATRRWVAAALVGVTLLGAALAALAIWLAPALSLLADERRTGKSFYVAAESMRPTLSVNDRIAPRVPVAGDLTRGTVVLVDVGEEAPRLYRIAAIGGDTVAVRSGTVWIGGRPAEERKVGPGPVLEGSGTTLMIERLPGERSFHRTIDAGPSDFDEGAPRHVPAGRLFLLGDNRDRAADSRVPAAEGGIGLVDEAHVIGVVDSVLWSTRRHRFGVAIEHAGE